MLEHICTKMVKKLSFIQKAIKVLTFDKELWEYLGKEEGVKSTVKYLVILFLISNLMFTGIVFFQSSYASSEDIEKVSYLGEKFGAGLMGGILFATVLIAGAQFLMVFVDSFILHLIVKLFGGKNVFSETFKALVYGSTPAILLGGIVGNFYSFPITIIGLSKLQNIGMWKSAFAILLVELVSFGVTILLATAFILAITL